MNIMELEFIEHEEAKKAAQCTKYNWVDLCGGQSLFDLKRELMRTKWLSEKEARTAFRNYFKDEIIALDWDC